MGEEESQFNPNKNMSRSEWEAAREEYKKKHPENPQPTLQEDPSRATNPDILNNPVYTKGEAGPFARVGADKKTTSQSVDTRFIVRGTKRNY